MVWYVAAGYKLPAGVEAYLLHYATELRRHGFDTRIIVFERLPRVKHRYLLALEARAIPIESLYEKCAPRVWITLVAAWLPWFLYTLLLKRQRPSARGLHAWLNKRCAVRRLQRMIRREQPDIVHVKARLIAESWPVFPPERTVYQHALSGALDSTWTPQEAAAFRDFLNRIARVFAPGRGVAKTLAREVGVTRPIDALFTMAPDEFSKDEGGKLKPETETAAELGGGTQQGQGRAERGSRPLRFGILCRFAPQKGIAYILEALRQFRDRHGDVHFTFAGHGELEAEICAFIDANDLKHVSVAQVHTPVESLEALDVFVHPGLDDAMPVSIVEALMCGKPCIATRVGGVPDLVRDGVEGLLIEPGSAGQIRLAMERFAGLTPAELAEYRRRARQRYEACCRPEVVGAQVAAIYHEILHAL